ncbi:MAG: hypothetical protein KA533_07450 [Sphingobium sp.]|nr:hypothetical protein [Sphingobium sp.]MBP6112588.1 hypothetical protein [Sphingobium sp.]MBP8671618.1 hypothetical protein [Sphingobium sp.]MBP9158618.1 hypothetical protein [Sphingobium sp.]
MAALPSDIALAKRPAVIVEQADSALQTRFPAARDGRESPATGHFDSATDGASALSLRFALIGTVRRRWQVDVADLIQPALASGLPCWRLTDAEQGVDAVCLVSRIEVDFENETTGLEQLG